MQRAFVGLALVLGLGAAVMVAAIRRSWITTASSVTPFAWPGIAHWTSCASPRAPFLPTTSEDG